MTVTAKLWGLDAFKGQMADMGGRLRAALVGALREGAAAVAEAAQERARALHDRAGKGQPHLADSIAVEDSADGARVVATAAHAGFVEFGTRRMPAQPFLGPAFAAQKNALGERCVKAVEAAAKEAV